MKLQLEISKRGGITFLVLLVLCVLGWVIIQNVDHTYRWPDKADKQAVGSLPQISDELTDQEIKTISKSVVTLNCADYQPGDLLPSYSVRGSGIYMNFPWSEKMRPVNDTDVNDKNRIYTPTNQGEAISAVISNAHVAQTYSYNNQTSGKCWIEFPDIDGYQSIRELLKDNDLAIESFLGNWHRQYNDSFDYSILGLYIRRQQIVEPLKNRILPNYSICNQVQPGKKVYIFGYPAAAFNVKTTVLGVSNIIVTEGIISGKSEDNYFTTAKIDAGNSGGLAISKIDNSICIVGIPTWVAEGEYENLGVIQPMAKILSDIK
ncbi:MAG: hypothetical protein WC734_04000 [Patescibacteria group bacterium]|jgi:hypothetical protein